MCRLLLVLLFGCSFAPGAKAQSSLALLLEKKDTVQALQLLKQGADINAVDEIIGYSPLMSVCRYGHDTVMLRFLLAHGANPNHPRTEAGRTPLITACAYYIGITGIKMLLDYGADVHAASQDGTTALMMASQNCKLKTVTLLLERGADANAAKRGGKLAMEFAKQADDLEEIARRVPDEEIDQQKVLQLLEKAMR